MQTNTQRAKAFIQQGNLKAAVNELLLGTKYNADLSGQINTHSARLNDMLRKESMGMLSFENASIIRNQVAFALLELIGSIEENSKVSQKRVFISYNHKDALIANKLKDALVKAGIDVTIDSEAMGAGDNIKQFIESCVRDTETTLSIVSKNSLLSAWVAMETLNTFGLQLGTVPKKFIPCYIEPDFFDIHFTDEALKQIEQKIDGLAVLIETRVKQGQDNLDINDEYSRLIRLRNSLGEIVGRLRNSLCMDITESKFEMNLPKIIQKINE
ncbi:TIR domain-containing protein [Niabella ginsengisoli]|uniref:Toll/interleukin-1 receptor domain-containing protein n=1 Tax=Niabella ginsengisoli TaxID=522298 RepID=A0ABS9SG68_9BACT|nr:TIR domain-containing protein [Niabella ginsengisoli]MCH5597325.1 toll/interleukin-1 receptor domain-containing protein [Niabella ginsengisoli]